MYTVKVNDGKYEFKLSDETASGWDALEYKAGYFHILHNNRSYRAEVLETDKHLKQFTIKVNGQEFDIQVEDKYDQLIKQMGFASLASQKVNQVKAPMPGLVVDVLVEKGQEVQKGSSLLILGAMKMDNVIKSPSDGVIKSIPISKGDAVDKNQILIELE